MATWHVILRMRTHMATWHVPHDTQGPSFCMQLAIASLVAKDVRMYAPPRIICTPHVMLSLQSRAPVWKEQELWRHKIAAVRCFLLQLASCKL